MKLTASERFLTLSHVIDDVAPEDGGELLRVVSAAFFATVRNMRGTTDDAEARFAIDRARAALLDVTRSP